MDQFFQIVGAVLILAAFFALQRRWVSPQSLLYTGVNLVGSSILAAVALIGSDWGFLMLQGVWAIVSTWSLFR